MFKTKPYLKPVAWVLLVAGIFMLSACDSEPPPVKDLVEAYNNASSYTMDFTMKTKENNKTIEVINKVDNDKEYIKFDDQEVYQLYRTGMIVRFFINEDGLWERSAPYEVDELQESFLSPDNIEFDWFEEGDGGYYVLKEAHYVDMFGEANEGVINIATIRDIEEGLEVYYSFEDSNMTFEYTAVIHSMDETEVEIPEVQVSDE